MKRKVGLLLGYNGKGYHGLQYNNDLRTIEKEIINILLKNECITELNSRDPQKIDLKSCSRTDKGVHASFNVVSVKIIQEPTQDLFKVLSEEFVKRNMVLYKIVKLPKRFIGHKCARSRTYKYIVPTYFLEEGNFEEEWRALREKDKKMIEDAGSADISDEKQRIYDAHELEPLKGHRSNAIDLFRKILKCYVGTHNYHNFTLKRTEGSMQRYIKEISVRDAFISDDIEYVEVVIDGQSFLLHQIRKMISFAVLNCKYTRNNYQENMRKALSNDDVHVPKSPAQYLFLSHVFFDDFNIKRSESGYDAIEVDETEKKKFEEEKIRPEILNTENLYEWFRYFDVARFHHENLEIFKSNKKDK